MKTNEEGCQMVTMLTVAKACQQCWTTPVGWDIWLMFSMEAVGVDLSVCLSTDEEPKQQDSVATMCPSSVGRSSLRSFLRCVHRAQAGTVPNLAQELHSILCYLDILHLYILRVELPIRAS